VVGVHMRGEKGEDCSEMSGRVILTAQVIRLWQWILECGIIQARAVVLLSIPGSHHGGPAESSDLVPFTHAAVRLTRESCHWQLLLDAFPTRPISRSSV